MKSFVTVVALVEGAARLAYGQTPPGMPASLRIHAPACADLPFALGPFLDLVRVELGAAGVARVETGASPPGAAAPAGTATLAIAVSPCRKDNDTVSIHLDGLPGATSAGRVLALGDVADAARPRALALAVGEFVRAQVASPPPGTKEPSSPVNHPPPSPPPPPSIAAGTTTPALAARTAGLFLVAEGQAQAFRAAADPLLGGRLALGFAPVAHPSIELRLDGGYAAGTVRRELGDVSFRLMSMGGGIFHAMAWRALRWRVGARFELGQARASGSDPAPGVVAHDADALVALAGALAGLDVSVTRHLAITLALEIALPLRGLGAIEGASRTAGLYGIREAAGAGVRVDF